MNIEEFMPKHISIEYNDESIGNVIKFHIKDEMYSGKHHCKIILTTIDMHSEYLNEDQKTMEIQFKEYMEIYNNVLKLNFNEMLINSGLIGLDGTFFKITIGYAFNYITFRLYCHDYEIIDRGLENINKIFNELLKKFKITKFLLKNETFDEEINNLTRRGEL
jgi:hypothetical protein